MCTICHLLPVGTSNYLQIPQALVSNADYVPNPEPDTPIVGIGLTILVHLIYKIPIVLRFEREKVRQRYNQAKVRDDINVHGPLLLLQSLDHAQKRVLEE